MSGLNEVAIYVVVQCRDCAEFENASDAADHHASRLWSKARRHARRNGHRVTVDITRTFDYQGQASHAKEGK